MNRQKGFTIIEVTVMLGVMMTAFAGLLAASKFNTESFNELRTSQRATQFADEIRFALANPDTCARNLGNIQILANGPAVASNPIYYYNTSGQRQSPVAVINGAVFDAVRLQQMSIVPVAQPEAEHIIGRYEVVLHRSNVIGSDTVIRSFPIDIWTNANRIVRCTTTVDSSDFVSQVRCDVAGGGEAYYDFDTRQCVPNDSIVVTGDALSVQCPEGSILPPTLGDGACWSQAPAGFEDTGAPEVTRTYEGGISYTYGPGAYRTRLDNPTNSCNCVYASEVDPSAWRCTLRCQTN